MRSKSSGSDPTKPKNRRHLKLCPLPYEPLTEAEKKDTSDPFDPNSSLSVFRLYPTILDIGFESLIGKERIDIYGLPRYLKFFYHRVSKIESSNSKSGIPISAGIGACLHFGCKIISSIPSVGSISSIYDEIETSDLDLDSLMSVDSALSSFSFTPQNPYSSKTEKKWQVRCSEEIKSDLSDLSTKLRIKISTLAISAMCCALSRSPYCHEGAKKHMEQTEKDLSLCLEKRAEDVKMIWNAYLEKK